MHDFVCAPLTEDAICAMHARLLRSTRIGKVDDDGATYSYLNDVGKYRRRLVYSNQLDDTASEEAEDEIIQYAPPDQVSELMRTFVDMANVS